MACNCEAQNEIDRLYKAYGDKSQLPANPSVNDYIKYYGGNILAYGLMFICFPLLVLYVLALLFWREDEKIHVSDIDLMEKFRFLRN